MPCGIIVNFYPKFATVERCFYDTDSREILASDGKPFMNRQVGASRQGGIPDPPRRRAQKASCFKEWFTFTERERGELRRCAPLRTRHSRATIATLHAFKPQSTFVLSWFGWDAFTNSAEIHRSKRRCVGGMYSCASKNPTSYVQPAAQDYAPFNPSNKSNSCEIARAVHHE